ncbi:hypothetical protein [Achromobacter sp. AGC25]
MTLNQRLQHVWQSVRKPVDPALARARRRGANAGWSRARPRC